ncbi:carbohydrate kinase family protein [Candidatus Saccharibacteria bacterium]|nr:carbohydrate kinase family protein [Candidatus Saccharibacteria bacterium]
MTSQFINKKTRKKSKYDCICIGDIVTDAFIRLEPEYTDIISDSDHRYLKIEYGSKVPFEYAKIIPGVGNAGNAARSLARLGLDVAIVTNVGDDGHGREQSQSLLEDLISLEFVKVNYRIPSNYHYVLWHKEERTILIKHEEFDYYWPRIPEQSTPEWVYLTSLGDHGTKIYPDLISWLQLNSQVRVAFQPGTFQLNLDQDKYFYQRAEIVVLNKEEAATLFGTHPHDIAKNAQSLIKLGAKIAVVTDGPDGSYLLSPERGFKKLHKINPFPDFRPPVERTGAGDSYASTMIAAVIKGQDLNTAMRWAGVNSAYVVLEVGAAEGLQSQNQIMIDLKNAPEDYNLTKIG